MHTPVGTFTWGTTVPKNIAASWAQAGQTHLVFPAELYAVWVALHTFAKLLQGTALLIFEDNEAARHSLTSGATANAAAALLVHYVWREFHNLDVLPWISRVPSSSNPADAPSRLQFNQGRALGWTKIPAKLPDCSVLPKNAPALASQLAETLSAMRAVRRIA